MYIRSKASEFLQLSWSLSRQHRNFGRRIDPGISKRKKLFADEDIQQFEDYDFDPESDFMNAGMGYKEYLDETKAHQEQERYVIVKQKYFKQKTPNFLTWNDKQQIRYLHNTNPEEWTMERLSQGFPALPEIIAKIVNSNWTKKNEGKIENHDAAVKENWKLFKERKLDLPQELAEHLDKFTNRDLNLKPFEGPAETPNNRPRSMLVSNIKIGTEFSNIITSYQKLKNTHNTQNSNEPKKTKLEKPPKGDTYLVGNINRRGRHVTLDVLQSRIKEKVQTEAISSDEQILLTTLSENDKNTSSVKLTSKITDITNTKYSTKEVSVKSDKKNYDFLEYPEKIVIPKDIFKPGYTYKLNDCYYDDDGLFLYRVPGMCK